MTTSEPAWLEILRGLEEPVARPEFPREWVEPEDDLIWVPRGFDHAEASARFTLLAERIEEVYGCECESSCGLRLGNACFGRIWIPADSTRTRAKRTRNPFAVEILVSTFGWMATCWPVGLIGNQVVVVQSDDRHRIQEAAESVGYLFVPEKALAAPYDGVNDWLVIPSDGETGGTWFDRFFYPM
ncbi:hypothetical protein AB0M47_20040 [Hamadaea sp. NPDC051192]|uniref:hypothetical protein n=1 Tax=Hamadaea sp. NPDC051192 TaxID=3154940 RepID=UPI003444D4A0